VVDRGESYSLKRGGDLLWSGTENASESVTSVVGGIVENFARGVHRSTGDLPALVRSQGEISWKKQVIVGEKPRSAVGSRVVLTALFPTGSERGGARRPVSFANASANLKFIQTSARQGAGVLGHVMKKNLRGQVRSVEGRRPKNRENQRKQGSEG